MSIGQAQGRRGKLPWDNAAIDKTIEIAERGLKGCLKSNEQIAVEVEPDWNTIDRWDLYLSVQELQTISMIIFDCFLELINQTDNQKLISIIQFRSNSK